MASPWRTGGFIFDFDSDSDDENTFGNREQPWENARQIQQLRRTLLETLPQPQNSASEAPQRRQQNALQMSSQQQQQQQRQNNALEISPRQRHSDVAAAPSTARRLGSIVLLGATVKGTSVNEIDLDCIEEKHPQMARCFKTTDGNGIPHPRPRLTLREILPAAVTGMIQFLVLDDLSYNVVESDDQNRCSLLLHLHVLKLALDFELPTLARRAKLNFTEDIELSCYTDAAPREYCEAIRFLYTKLRTHIDLRQTVAHYCVSCYNYHRLGQSEAFRQTSFECSAFHKDLLLANLRSDFSADSALQIIHLPVCSNPVHRSHEAWATGHTDFTCQFHDGKTFESTPNTPRAGPQHMADGDLRPEYLVSLPLDSPAITPVSITPVPSSPSRNSQASWTDIDTDAEWSEAELPPSYDFAVREALRRLKYEEHPRASASSSPSPPAYLAPVSLPERRKSRPRPVQPAQELGSEEDSDDNDGDDENDEEEDRDYDYCDGVDEKTDKEEDLSSSVANLALRPKRAAEDSADATVLSSRQTEKLPLRGRAAITGTSEPLSPSKRQKKGHSSHHGQEKTSCSKQKEQKQRQQQQQQQQQQQRG